MFELGIVAECVCLGVTQMTAQSFLYRVTAITRLTVAQQTKWVNIESMREYSLKS